MARLLIVSLNYAPEQTGIAPYSTGVAEHLAARGHDVTVVAGTPHYPAWRAEPARKREFRGGVDVRRVRHYVPRTQSTLRRGLYEASSLSMMRAASHIRPDAVLGVMPSLSGGLVARATAVRCGVPYGLIIQDLMGPAAAQSSVRGGGRAQRAVRAAEGWAARGAAAIGIVAEGFRPYVESLGVAPARIVRVRNWSREAAVPARADDMRLLLNWPAGAIVCLYAGNMGYKQGLENVIECARIAAPDDSRLLFVLMGGGNQYEAIATIARREGLRNLRVMPLQSDDVYAGALCAADVLLVNQRGTVREMSLPSKLTSYFAAGRPVVAAVAPDSETAREIADSGAGIRANPDDPAALLSAVRRVAGDADLARYLAERGRRWSTGVLLSEAALAAYERLVAGVLGSKTGLRQVQTRHNDRECEVSAEEGRRAA